MPFGMRHAFLYGERSKQMKKALLAMVLLAGSALAGPRISIGIGFGAPAPAMVRPACPGPGYAWVDGYYGRNHVWVPGFWRRPALVVAPRVVAPHSYSYDNRRNDYRRDDHRNDFRHDDHRNDFRHDFHR